MVTFLPKSVAQALWSYNTAALDQERDKRLIIKNVLDDGTGDAIRWVHTTYHPGDIKEVIRETPRSAWHKKTLPFLKVVYDTEPARATRLG